jgi:hypothetical protein
MESRGFEADGSDEGVEIVDDALIEAIELGSPLGFEPGICFDGTEKACREWGIDAFEEFQEDEADPSTRVGGADSGESSGAWQRGLWRGVSRDHCPATQFVAGRV